MNNEIQRLTDAAVDIAQIDDMNQRHKGGLWLEGELEALYDTSWATFTVDERTDFQVVTKILLDVIFRDAVQDSLDLVGGADMSSGSASQQVSAALRAAGISP